MLKQTKPIGSPASFAAAFRRLCVETLLELSSRIDTIQPPSGGCVLKLFTRIGTRLMREQPPSGGCVLKHFLMLYVSSVPVSRLQAAVC